MTMVRRYLSNKERILLHLSTYSGELNYFNAPYALTQDGIAEAIGIGRNNVPRELKTLLEKGLVEAHKARVTGLKNRRTVYILTSKGAIETKKIKEKIENLVVNVISTNGEREKLPLKEVSKKYGITLISAAINLDKNLNVDLISIVRKRGKKIKHIEEKYIIGRFYGRKEEMEKLKKWLKGSKKILALTGMHGVGKTTLMLKFIDVFAQDRDVFFIKILPTDGPMEIVSKLSEFLTRIGMPKLARYIHAQKNSIERDLQWSNIISIISESISNEIYIFDDLDEASAETKKFLEKLMENLDYTKNFKIVLIGSGADEIPPFSRINYVEDMHLGDLDKESAFMMLRDEGVDETTAMKIISKYGANPLILSLAKGNNHRMIRRYIVEEILKNLTDDERYVVEFMSVLRKPVKITMLLLNNIEYSTIYSLINKNILIEMEYEIVTIHRVIREFVYEHLTSEKKKKYHMMVAENMLQENEIIDAIYHFLKAGLVLRANVLLTDNYESLIFEKGGVIRKIAKEIMNMHEDYPHLPFGSLHEIIGDTYHIEGDWDSATLEYETALKLISTEDYDIRARITLKLANIMGKRGEKDKTISMLLELLRYEKMIRNRNYIALAYYILGNMYISKKNMDEAEASFMDALKYAESFADYKTLGYIYNGLGILYTRLEDTTKAISYFKRAFEYLEAVDDKLGMIKVLSNMGTLYYNLRNDEAGVYLKKAIKLVEITGDKWSECTVLHHLGAYYLYKDDVVKAEKYLFRAKEIGEHMKLKPKLFYIYIAIGELYAYKGDKKNAITYFDKAMEIALEQRNEKMINTFIEEANVTLSKFDINVDQYLERITSVKKSEIYLEIQVEPYL